MDYVQIYYIVLLIVGTTHQVVSIARSKDSSEMAQTIVTAVITNLMTVPIAGRIFLWW